MRTRKKRDAGTKAASAPGEDGMRIEYVPLDEIVRWPRNPKLHDIGGLDDSIERFGFVGPVIRDEKTGRLVAGHGRLETLEKKKAAGHAVPERVKVDSEGRWLVPVVMGVEFRDEMEAEAYLLADNRLVELGGWDNDELLAMLEAHKEAGEGAFVGVGFNDSELARLIRVKEHDRRLNTPPSEFPDAENGSKSDYRCPQCSYEWTGNPR